MKLSQNLDTIQSSSGVRIAFTSDNSAEIVSNLLPYVFGAAGIVLLINIISSGFKIMTSVGDPKKMQAAQAKLSTSLIGILILLASFWIVQLLMDFLGVDSVIFK